MTKTTCDGCGAEVDKSYLILKGFCFCDIKCLDGWRARYYVERIKLGSNDKLLVRVPGEQDSGDVERITDMMRKDHPDVPAIIYAGAIEISILEVDDV